MLMTIRSKLLALAVLAVGVALLVGAVGLYGTNKLEISTRHAENYGILAQTQMRTDALHDHLLTLAERHLLLAREGNAQQASETAKALREEARHMQAEFLKNQSLPALPHQAKAFILRLRPLLDEYAAQAERLAATPASDFKGMQTHYARFVVLFRKTADEMNEFNSHLLRDLEATRKETEATSRESFTRLSVAICFGVLLLLAGAFLVYKSISLGLGTLEDAIVKVNNGDTTVRVHLKTEDELGRVARSFDTLLDERLATATAQQKENQLLSLSAIELLESMEQLTKKDLSVKATVRENVIGTIAQSVNQLTQETGQALAEVQDLANRVQTAVEAVRRQGLAVRNVAMQEQALLKEMADLLQIANNYIARVSATSDASRRAANRALNTHRLETESIARHESFMATLETGNLGSQANHEIRTALSPLSGLVRDLHEKASHHEVATGELTALVFKLAELASQQQEMADALEANVGNINDGTQKTTFALGLQTQAIDTLTMVAEQLNETVSQFRVPLLTPRA
jgi:methyl-accepting chemotaxis protein